jgi:HEPN domain-containing protein
MLSTQEMRRIAFARLSDAEALHRAKRFDGASYLCGYSVELALKARICKTLKWAGYPQTNAEFQGLASFKVHDLEMLLRLSGKAAIVKGKYLAEWSGVMIWRPEDRYNPIGTANETDARIMLDSAKTLLKTI